MNVSPIAIVIFFKKFSKQIPCETWRSNAEPAQKECPAFYVSMGKNEQNTYVYKLYLHTYNTIKYFILILLHLDSAGTNRGHRFNVLFYSIN